MGKHTAHTRGAAATAPPVGRRGARAPGRAGTASQGRVAAAAGGHAPRRPHEPSRGGEAGQVRRGPQAMAGRTRDVEARGRPRKRRGHPAGGGVRSPGKPAAGLWGVCSRSGLGGGERPRPGAGRDGRTSPAQDTSAGPGWPGPADAHRPAGPRPQRASPPATPRAGAVARPSRGAVGGLLARPAHGCGQGGRPRPRGGRCRHLAGHDRRPGTAAARATRPGHPRHRMRAHGPSGTARGVPGHRHSYRRDVSNSESEGT